MTLILAFFGAHIGGLLAGGGVLLAIVVSFFTGHSVASSKVAAAKSDAALANAKVSAVTSADDAKTEASAIPSTGLDAEGKNLGILRD